MSFMRRVKGNGTIRKLIRGTLFFFAGLVFILLLATIFLSLYRDEIGEKILLNANEKYVGQIGFQSLSFTPFTHFPNISVRLKEFYFVSSGDTAAKSPPDTLAEIDQFYISFHLIDLIRGNINLDQLTASGGKILLKTLPGGRLNFSQALSSNTSAPTDSLSISSDDLNSDFPIVSAEYIRILNMDLIYQNDSLKKQVNIFLQELNAEIRYAAQQISGLLEVDANVDQVAFPPGIDLPDLSVGLKSSFSIGLDSLTVDLEDGVLDINNSRFQFQGGAQLLGKTFTDLQLEGSDENLSFFRLWMSDEGFDQLTVGNTYFSGSVKGSLDRGIPNMIFKFGMEDVFIDIPEVDQDIRDLKLNGRFTSGTASNLSEASLTINELSGKLPGGFIKANVSVNNFVAPRFKLYWDMELIVDHFEDLLDIESLDSLYGRIKVFDNVEGYYDEDQEKIIEEFNESMIIFDSLQFKIGNTFEVDHLDGILRRHGDTINLSNVRINAQQSDLNFNGDIYGLFSVLTDEGASLTADLSMLSDTFDFPKFFSFDPRVGESFPFRILNIYGEFTALANRSQLFEFHSNPEIVFEFSRFDATIENLFPPVEIKKGTLHMREKEDRLYLDFLDFHLLMEDAKIKTDVEYFSPATDPDFVGVDMDFKDLDPSRVFFLADDTLPGIAVGQMNGKLQSELEIALDTNDFRRFYLTSSTMDYVTEKDTFDITDLQLSAEDVSYRAGTDPLASLTAGIEIRAGKVLSNHFQTEDIHYRIDARNGGYIITPESIRFFGKEGKGKYIARPFDEIPVYEVNYKVNDFQIENFLTNLMEDTVLRGSMSLDMSLLIKKEPNAELLKSLTGYLKVNGSDLTLYGIDLDDFIKKYQRSQKFNLVDVGAIALAGPVGLALTKGTQFANLAVGDYGDKTNLELVVSEWECIDGRFFMKDCAMATDENRISAKGWIDVAADSLEVTVAVLDKNGCSIASQSIFGSLDDPEYSDVNVVGTILGPVTNLMDVVLGKDCEVFYSGKISHPIRKKKNE